jgi:hypothetical protein
MFGIMEAAPGGGGVSVRVGVGPTGGGIADGGAMGLMEGAPLSSGGPAHPLRGVTLPLTLEGIPVSVDGLPPLMFFSILGLGLNGSGAFGTISSGGGVKGIRGDSGGFHPVG